MSRVKLASVWSAPYAPSELSTYARKVRASRRRPAVQDSDLSRGQGPFLYRTLPVSGPQHCVLFCAALSPTPDWRAKTEWLLGQPGLIDAACGLVLSSHLPLCEVRLASAELRLRTQPAAWSPIPTRYQPAPTVTAFAPAAG
jgi:hypothetical protein